MGQVVIDLCICVSLRKAFLSVISISKIRDLFVNRVLLFTDYTVWRFSVWPMAAFIGTFMVDTHLSCLSAFHHRRIRCIVVFFKVTKRLRRILISALASDFFTVF